MAMARHNVGPAGRRRIGITPSGLLAALALSTAALLAGGPAQARNQPVICESQNYGYQHCSMKTSYGVVLVTQISRGRGECIKGQSWGWDSGGVWVTQGCRASFIQGNWASDFPEARGNGGGSSGGFDSGGGGFSFSGNDPFDGGSSSGRCYRPQDAVTCVSQNYRYTHCPMKTSYGVKIVAQMSSGRGECVEGRTWGWDSGGVWVDGGCRGKFIQGNWDACGPTPGVRQSSSSSPPPAAASAGIPVTGMPWRQNGDNAPSGGWRPPEQDAGVSQRDLAACRDSLNNYVHQQASQARRVAIDVEHTDARRQGGNIVVEEVAQVSTDFGNGRLSYRCTLSSAGHVIAFDARDQ